MSRDFILERIKKNVTGDMKVSGRENSVTERLRSTPVGVLPEAAKNCAARLNQFMAKVEAAQATIVTTPKTGVAESISKWLRDHNLPTEICMGADKRLDKIFATRKHALTIKQGPSEGNDLVGISHGEQGIAETGTLILFSGPDNPTTLNFLPENHIVILNQSDIIDHYEEVWPSVRKQFGKGKMPRTLNMITGPSRSADIEQTLFLGAHGPLRLHVIIVRD